MIRWLALACIVLLAVLFASQPPSGLEGADWLQFVGRFHLLTVHFPIALVLLVPVFELAGRHSRLPFLRASAESLLVLALFSALAAAVLGWCLARNGAYSGRLVTQHMWAGLAVAAACWLCWSLRPYLSLSYGLLLAATVLLVSFTGYRGGQLTQGENHLTEHMPSPLRSVLGLSSPPLPRSDPAFFYGAHVEPIFVTHCYECHGPDKQKGQLRLDSYLNLMRGGKHGPVIKPGNVKGSELLRRVTMAQTDDDAMPPQGKRALSAGEVKVLELWIAGGASPSLAANGIQVTPESAPVTEVTFPEVDAAAVSKARAPLAASVAQIRQRFPDALDYESRSSAGLAVDASALAAKFGDDDLAAMQPVAGQLITMDLSGTAITDRSASVLAQMKHLRVLRLTGTKITDATVTTLQGFDQLESLDLYGTAVTPACLKQLEALPKLRHVYVGATKIVGDARIPEDLKARLVY